MNFYSGHLVIWISLGKDKYQAWRDSFLVLRMPRHIAHESSLNTPLLGAAVVTTL